MALVNRRDLGAYGFGAFGTPSTFQPGTECPPEGSWENYCDCMFAADDPNREICRSKPSGGCFGVFWASPPWTVCGKAARWGDSADSILNTFKNAVQDGTGMVNSVIPGAIPEVFPSTAPSTGGDAGPFMPGVTDLSSGGARPGYIAQTPTPGWAYAAGGLAAALGAMFLLKKR